jgi:hypothetical protein
VAFAPFLASFFLFIFYFEVSLGVVLRFWSSGGLVRVRVWCVVFGVVLLGIFAEFGCAYGFVALEIGLDRMLIWEIGSGFMCLLV